MPLPQEGYKNLPILVAASAEQQLAIPFPSRLASSNAADSSFPAKPSAMRLPENGRLFVGGIAPGTGDADLRCHFSRYGEVAEVCLPRDRHTGRPRCFAFVQFTRPSDAGRALADPHHVIRGRQVYTGRAQPKQSESFSNRMPQYKPLSQRTYKVGKWRYRVGDLARISFGPLGDKYEGCEYVNKIRKFGVIIDNVLIFDCMIGYISEDGKECLIRWPPGQSDDKSAWSRQGNIIGSCCSSLKDFAQLSQSWCWLLQQGLCS